MDRQAARRLADELIGGLDPSVGNTLRPVLVEAFDIMETPHEKLIIRGTGAGNLKAYTLCSNGLFVVDVQSEPPGVRVDWVDLADATITRQSHDLKATHDGIWWDTTWRLECGDVSEVFSGREGPQHSIDQVAEFGRAVAQAAGWPIAASVPD